MKSLPVVILSLLCTTTWAQVTGPAATPRSQLPAVNSGLTFEAKLVSSGGATRTEHDNLTNTTVQKFESTQTHESKSRVEMVVRNLGTMPAQARFDWFFVARDTQSRREFVWDQGQRDLAIPAGGQEKHTFESKPLTQTTRRKSEFYNNTNTLGQQPAQQQQVSTEQTGGKPFGWIVRMWDGERLLQVQASSTDLETIGRDPALLGKLTQAPTGPPR